MGCSGKMSGLSCARYREGGRGEELKGEWEGRVVGVRE